MDNKRFIKQKKNALNIENVHITKNWRTEVSGPTLASETLPQRRNFKVTDNCHLQEARWCESGHFLGLLDETQRRRSCHPVRQLSLERWICCCFCFPPTLVFLFFELFLKNTNGDWNINYLKNSTYKVVLKMKTCFLLYKLKKI